MSRYSEEYKESIVKEYIENGKSISELVKVYHHKDITISKWIKEAGHEVVIGLRPMRFSKEQEDRAISIIKDHGSVVDVAKCLQIDPTTAKKFVEKLNLSVNYRKTNKEVKEDFFDVIDSEVKAYLLGLFYTDGNVRKQGNTQGQLRFSLQLQDESLVNRIKKELNIDSLTLYDKRPGKEMAGFEVTNEKLYNGLVKHGVIPNKTYQSKSIPWIENQEYIIPLLRGMFDGDGTLSFKSSCHDVGVGFTNFSEEVVSEFQIKIDTLINKENRLKIKHKDDESGTNYSCNWRGRRQVLKILSALYDNATIYLPRKVNKYIKLKSTTEDDIV